jgi:hypothetical protein
MTSITGCYWHVLSRVLLVLFLAGAALSQYLNDTQVDLVSARLAEGAKARSELFYTFSI